MIIVSFLSLQMYESVLRGQSTLRQKMGLPLKCVCCWKVTCPHPSSFISAHSMALPKVIYGLACSSQIVVNSKIE